MPRDPDHYDRRYFDRWYRDPAHRVFTAAERARRVAVVLAASEYVLGRPVRSVLDIGAGEGHWRGPILRMRPKARYVGIDPSPYVVQRFGRRRGIQLGDIATLEADSLPGPFDVVLAVGFLNLLPTRALRASLQRITPLIGGVALLELFTDQDPVSGDVRQYQRAATSSYRRMLRACGLVGVGLHLYARQELTDNLGVLERSI
jgi:SAM-dependent methyltransferase